MINPLTGIDDELDPSGILNSGMPRPPATEQIVDTGLAMPPGAADTGAPPELATAQQVLAQADAVLGPSSMPGGGAGAAPAAPAPQAGIAPPVAPPPLAGLMTGSTAQKRTGIQQQQVAGLEAGRALDDQQGALDDRAAAVRGGVAATNAATENLRSVNVDRQQEERQAAQNLYNERLQRARAESDAAVQTWMNAKPTDWWDEDQDGQKDGGKQLWTSFLIALAHVADDLGRQRGRPSNVGQQAIALVNQTVDRHRAGELARIEKLHQAAVKKTGDIDRLSRERADALARIEDKYAGIEKSLEAQARAQRAELGLDQAGIEHDQVVINHKRRALEAEQRRLDALGQFVDKETALELQARRRTGGRGRGGGGAADPNDPYAGLTPYQRLQAERRDAESELLGLNGEVLGKARGGPKAAKELGDAQAAALTMSDLSNRMKEWIDRNGTVEVMDRGAVQERKGIIVDAAAALTVLKRTGVLNEGEKRTYEDMFAPGFFSSDDQAKSALDSMVRRTNDNYMRQVGSQLKGGAQPMQQAVSQQPAANRVLPAGAEPITYKGIEGYRMLKGTNAQGKKIYEFFPWPGQ